MSVDVDKDCLIVDHRGVSLCVFATLFRLSLGCILADWMDKSKEEWTRYFIQLDTFKLFLLKLNFPASVL